MTATIPTTEPQSITAGDTAAWTRNLGDYPASAGWVLSYVLINAAKKISISSTASGDTHAVTVAAATTAAWPAGTYSWQAVVTKAAERYTVATGTMVIRPNLAAATLLDQRSPARKALDAADLALASYGAKAYLQEYEIAGRRQRFASAGEFLAWRDRLRAECSREENAARIKAGLASRNTLYTRFCAR